MLPEMCYSRYYVVAIAPEFEIDVAVLRLCLAASEKRHFSKNGTNRYRPSDARKKEDSLQ